MRYSQATIFLIIMFLMCIGCGWADMELNFLPHGVFVAGLGVKQQSVDPVTSTTAQIRAGIFDHIEIQADSILKDKIIVTKAKLLTEQGKLPQIVVGISNQRRYQLLFSKSLNLPKIHILQFCCGISNLANRQANNQPILRKNMDEITISIGGQKLAQPVWADGDLLLRWYTNITNNGFSFATFTTRLIMKTGLWLDLQVTKRIKTTDVRGQISWSNQQILAEIESVKRLVKNVIRVKRQKNN